MTPPATAPALTLLCSAVVLRGVPVPVLLLEAGTVIVSVGRLEDTDMMVLDGRGDSVTLFERIGMLPTACPGLEGTGGALVVSVDGAVFALEDGGISVGGEGVGMSGGSGWLLLDGGDGVGPAGGGAASLQMGLAIWVTVALSFLVQAKSGLLMHWLKGSEQTQAATGPLK